MLTTLAVGKQVGGQVNFLISRRAGKLTPCSTAAALMRCIHNERMSRFFCFLSRKAYCSAFSTLGCAALMQFLLLPRKPLAIAKILSRFIAPAVQEHERSSRSMAQLASNSALHVLVIPVLCRKSGGCCGHSDPICKSGTLKSSA